MIYQKMERVYDTMRKRRLKFCGDILGTDDGRLTKRIFTKTHESENGKQWLETIKGACKIQKINLKPKEIPEEGELLTHIHICSKDTSAENERVLVH